MTQVCLILSVVLKLSCMQVLKNISRKYTVV